MTKHALAPERARHATEEAARLRGVWQRYGDFVAIADLSLDVPRGAIFGFIGPSGSGKTTTVRAITGIEAPAEGTVEVLDQDPMKFDAADRARIGYMPQLSVMFPRLSIQENLSFAASIYGVGWRRAKRLDAVLDFVELTEHRGKVLRDASGGMQRRLALAAALVHDPELLVLDEPTGGIDPVLRRKLWEHFRSLRDEGRTLFVTTQYVGEAAYCDQVGILAEGRLRVVDTPEGLRRRAFGGDRIDVVLSEAPDDTTLHALRSHRTVRSVRRTPETDGRGLRVTIDAADEGLPALQRWFADRGVRVETVNHDVPSFDDVFVELLAEDQQP